MDRLAVRRARVLERDGSGGMIGATNAFHGARRAAEERTVRGTALARRSPLGRAVRARRAAEHEKERSRRVFRRPSSSTCAAGRFTWWAPPRTDRHRRQERSPLARTFLRTVRSRRGMVASRARGALSLGSEVPDRARRVRRDGHTRRGGERRRRPLGVTAVTATWSASRSRGRSGDALADGRNGRNDRNARSSTESRALQRRTALRCPDATWRC